jgi:hypothetical protein
MRQAKCLQLPRQAAIHLVPAAFAAGTHVVDASHRTAIEAVERKLFPSVPKSADQLAEAVPVSDTVN